MQIPASQEFLKPLLDALKDTLPHNYSINDLAGIIADYIGEDLNEMSSGDKNILRERVKTARDELKQHGLISSPSQNTYMITNVGLEILGENPDIIDDVYLSNFRTRGTKMNDQEIEFETEEIENAPEESGAEEITTEIIDDIKEDISDSDSSTIEPESASALEEILEKFNASLENEILNRAASIPSDKFESLVIDLLSKMGYRAFHNARYTNEALSTPGDDCIHGVILESEPGLSPIYIQARKLSPSKVINKSDIEEFINALNDKGGKGLFATTASFSEQAIDFARAERIMLIDGNRLANLMITSNFCVSVEKVFEIKSLDSESFSEYEK